MPTTTRRMLPVALLLFAVGGVTPAMAQGGGDNLPDSVTLTGTVRDFLARNQNGGHDDFEWQPKKANGRGSYGHYIDIVADELDADGKPVFSTQGRKVTREWKDGNGNKIMQPRSYMLSMEGDSLGNAQRSGLAVHNAEGFAQWFRDTPGVNLSVALPVTLHREPGTNKYVFDDKSDSVFSSLGGFFPINQELFGNYNNTGKNFHFTYELATEFVYQADAGQEFRFIGDDDVWVFVDGKLVIDLGGVHGALDQTVLLDRLSWLQDGETYSLHFFFAERHTTQSNFRIETTLQLRDINVPTVSGLFD
ncbi:MAG: fibro-slime domain-containing protein [Planctomycetota bacterium]|nr:fibro-slime domain-containing protein [Planctomycetota bacterium]